MSYHPKDSFWGWFHICLISVLFISLGTGFGTCLGTGFEAYLGANLGPGCVIVHGAGIRVVLEEVHETGLGAETGLELALGIGFGACLGSYGAEIGVSLWASHWPGFGSCCGAGLELVLWIVLRTGFWTAFGLCDGVDCGTKKILFSSINLVLYHKAIYIYLLSINDLGEL